MAHPLDEAGAKLARARTHLEELDREVRAFVEAHPYEIWTDHNSEPGVGIVCARALAPEEPVPALVGTIVGDVLHNLRSALEYLAWQLAVIGKGPDNNTHFPVCETPKHWRDFGKGYVARMRPEHARVIEELQPYHRGHTPYLLAVARLNNSDKHALIPAVGWAVKFRPPTIRGGVRRLTIEYEEDVPMKDGAVLMRVVEFEGIPGQEVDAEMPLPYTVLFGKPFTPGEEAVSKLDLVRAERYVRLILRLFRDAF